MQSERWGAVGTYVSAAVASAGRSPEELEAVIGVGAKTIRKIMDGTPAKYRAGNVAQLARFMGVENDWLERLLAGKRPRKINPRADPIGDVDVLAEIRDGVRAMILQTSRQEAQLVEVVGLVRRLDEQVGELADRMSLLERRRGSSAAGAPSEPHVTGQGHRR